MKASHGSASDLQPWAELRAALWPDASIEEHRREVAETFLSGADTTTAFLCRDDDGWIVGLAEVALRSDYVNGCETSPVLFLEGIYVRPEARRRGVGRLLCAAAAAWGRSRGCSEFASDARLDNIESRRFHAALGFEETEQVVFFRRALAGSSDGG